MERIALASPSLQLARVDQPDGLRGSGHIVLCGRKGAKRGRPDLATASFVTVATARPKDREA